MTGEQQDNLQPSCGSSVHLGTDVCFDKCVSMVHMTKATLNTCMNHYSTLPPEVSYTVLNNMFATSVDKSLSRLWMTQSYCLH